MLITDEYKKQNRMLYERGIGYGGSSGKLAHKVLKIVSKYEIRSFIDYGCGQQRLWESMVAHNPKIHKKIKYIPYDPCIKEVETLPKRPVDLVVCSDVMEHIEPECLDSVLSHIRSLTKKIFYCYVATHNSNKTLPDGRNAHLIVEPMEWWEHRLSLFFPDIKCKSIKWNRFEGVWKNEI